MDQRRRDISRLTVRNRSRRTLLHSTGFRSLAATFCKEVAANLKRVSPAVMPVIASQGAGHKNPEHKSKEVETRYRPESIALPTTEAHSHKVRRILGTLQR